MRLTRRTPTVHRRKFDRKNRSICLPWLYCTKSGDRGVEHRIFNVKGTYWDEHTANIYIRHKVSAPLLGNVALTGKYLIKTQIHTQMNLDSPLPTEPWKSSTRRSFQLKNTWEDIAVRKVISCGITWNEPWRQFADSFSNFQKQINLATSSSCLLFIRKCILIVMVVLSSSFRASVKVRSQQFNVNYAIVN